MLIDLHAYSHHTGGMPLHELVEQAKSNGLDGICVADRGASAETARAIADGTFGEFSVFVGVELQTRQGDVIVVSPNVDPFMTREEWRQLTALERPELEQVVGLMQAEGGVVLLVHPYDRARKASPGDRLFAMEGLAGLEVGTAASESRANRTAIEAVTRSSLPGFAGSALRRASGEKPSWMTLFGDEVSTQEELVAALAGGDFWPVCVGGSDERRGGGRRGGRGERGNRGERGDRGDRGDRRGGRRGGGGGRRRGGRS